MTEKKWRNRKHRVQKLWLLAVLLCVAILLLSACKCSVRVQEPSKEENASVTESSSDTAENTKTEAEESEPEETIDLSQFQNLEIVDSKYQFVNDYEWEDLYTLLAGVAQTTTGLEYRKPYMLIVRLDAEWDPLLFIGLKNNDSDTMNLEVYVIDDGYLYRLIGFDDEVYYHPDTQFFYLKNAGKKYIYAPHVFLEGEAAQKDWPEGTKPLPIQEISNIRISVDNLDDFILDLSEGGDSE